MTRIVQSNKDRSPFNGFRGDLCARMDAHDVFFLSYIEQLGFYKKGVAAQRGHSLNLSSITLNSPNI